MKEILESLDLSEEIKVQLQEAFDKAVESELKIQLDESKAEFEKSLTEATEDKFKDLEATMEEYLTTSIAEFISEKEAILEGAIKDLKADMVLESFNAMVVATGADLIAMEDVAKKVTEAKEEKVYEDARILAERNDQLMKEKIDLKAANDKLTKLGLIKEASENLTAVAKEKFLNLVSVVEYDSSKPAEYINKLITIAESVKETKVEKVETVVESINESKVEVKSWQAASKHLY